MVCTWIKAWGNYAKGKFYIGNSNSIQTLYFPLPTPCKYNWLLSPSPFLSPICIYRAAARLTYPLLVRKHGSVPLRQLRLWDPLQSLTVWRTHARVQIDDVFNPNQYLSPFSKLIFPSMNFVTKPWSWLAAKRSLVSWVGDAWHTLGRKSSCLGGAKLYLYLYLYFNLYLHFY